MIGLISGFLRPFATPLAGAAGFLGALLMFAAYNNLIDNPRVAAEARKDYVAQVQYDTLKFQLDAERRNRALAEKATRDFADKLAIERNIQAELEWHYEQEIANYETRLEATGRSCRLDDADIEWLRKH